MTYAAVNDLGAAGEYRLLERTTDLGAQRRVSSTAQVAEESLQNPEVGISLGFERHGVVVQRHLAADFQQGTVSDKPQPRNVEPVPIECQLDRTIVLQGVVEQLEVEALTCASTTR